jgi:hypothetical protein
MKSLLTSITTGVSIELLQILFLYLNFSNQFTLIVGDTLGYIVAYIAQYHILDADHFYGITLLKYFAIGIITIQLSIILLRMLENNPTIKEYIEDEKISEFRRKTYDYILINVATIIVFFCLDYPLRNLFIFRKNNNDYLYCYMFFIMSIVVYLIYSNNFDYHIT